MSDPTITDSGAPIHPLSPGAIHFAETYKAQIIYDAKIAGIPASAVIGPMAREMTRTQVDHPILGPAREIQSRENALFHTVPDKYSMEGGITFEMYSHKDYADDMKAVKNGVRHEGIAKLYFRVMGATDHPVLNDLPPGNIRPVAAIDSLEYYLSHPDKFKGDPFNWNQYAGHYDKLVQDLAMPVNGKVDSLSIQISAVNGARIDNELKNMVSNWGSCTDDQRAAAITAFSASGGTQFYAHYHSNGDKPFELKQDDLKKTDGANYLLAPLKDGTSNLDRLHKVLGDVKHYAPNDLRSPENPKHAQYEKVRDLVANAYDKRGMPLDLDRLERTAACVMYDAQKSHLKDIKEVRLNPDPHTHQVGPNSHLLAFSGNPQDVTTRKSVTDVQQAQQHTPEQTYQQLGKLVQHQAQVHAQLQVHQAHHVQPMVPGGHPGDHGAGGR